MTPEPITQVVHARADPDCMDLENFRNMTPEERERWTRPWELPQAEHDGPISRSFLRAASQPRDRSGMKLAAISPALALVRWAWRAKR
jgi:hypothetical protein